MVTLHFPTSYSSKLEGCSPELEAPDGSGQRGDWVHPHSYLPISLALSVFIC